MSEARGKRAMLSLRHFGVYNLPGRQRSVYAVHLGKGRYYLYDTQYGAGLPPRFEVRADGAMLDWHGREAPLMAEDLTDTGETVSR